MGHLRFKEVSHLSPHSVSARTWTQCGCRARVLHTKLKCLLVNQKGTGQETPQLPTPMLLSISQVLLLLASKPPGNKQPKVTFPKQPHRCKDVPSPSESTFGSSGAWKHRLISKVLILGVSHLSDVFPGSTMTLSLQRPKKPLDSG